jgi:hypothetical protein
VTITASLSVTVADLVLGSAASPTVGASLSTVFGPLTAAAAAGPVAGASLSSTLGSLVSAGYVGLPILLPYDFTTAPEGTDAWMLGEDLALLVEQLNFVLRRLMVISGG